VICVLGDYIDDVYIYGEMNRRSPESPILIFNEQSKEIRWGGSANVVANLQAFNLDPKHYFSKNSIKTRYVCDNKIVFRSDNDCYVANINFDFDLSNITHCIISDYNKGFIHDPQQIISYCKQAGCKVIVDPKKNLQNYKNADIVKLNYSEVDIYSDFKHDYKKIRQTYNIGSLIITLGAQGVYIDSDEFVGQINSQAHQVADVTGAGDVFLAAMTYFLFLGNSLYDSCVKANTLAGISVTKFGTYTLAQDDIKQAITVFTNGCFDILHRGHIDYLQKSKSLGAKLIVGLNSDASVQALKGACRPINSEQDRKAVLESLGFVDQVIIFDELTPYTLIQKIKPDIITKGGDYTAAQVVGNDLAKVCIIPFVKGYSTSDIIGKIK